LPSLAPLPPVPRRRCWDATESGLTAKHHRIGRPRSVRRGAPSRAPPARCPSLSRKASKPRGRQAPRPASGRRAKSLARIRNEDLGTKTGQGVDKRRGRIGRGHMLVHRRVTYHPPASGPRCSAPIRLSHPSGSLNRRDGSVRFTIGALPDAGLAPMRPRFGRSAGRDYRIWYKVAANDTRGPSAIGPRDTKPGRFGWMRPKSRAARVDEFRGGAPARRLFSRKPGSIRLTLDDAYRIQLALIRRHFAKRPASAASAGRSGLTAASHPTAIRLPRAGLRLPCSTKGASSPAISSVHADLIGPGFRE